MIPKLLHQTARSKILSWEEERLSRRLRRMNPAWAYRRWDDADNLGLIHEYFPHYAGRYEAIPFGVARSDVARYIYMHAFGGFYLDTDYKMLRPLSDELRASACIIPLEGADPQFEPATPDYPGLGNAFMGSVPGHPFWSRLIDHIFEVRKPHLLVRGEDVIPATGPEAMTRFYLAHADDFPDIDLPAKPLFYPAMHLLGTRIDATPQTYGVHLHWGSWRNKSLNVAARTVVRRKINGLLS